MATEAEPQPSRGRRPWERIAGRLYGPPRPGAFAEAAKDLKSWVRQDRVVLVAGAGLVLLAGLLTLAGVQTVGHAATATYTLLGLFGLWLIVVQTGQPALGHAALMGLGAYLTAFLRLRAGLDGLTAAIVAALFCGGAGWALGWGTSRLRPAFTSLATWSFGWLATLSVVAFPDISGGTAGITFGAPMKVKLAPLGIDAGFNEAGHLLLAAVLLGGAMLVLRSAQRSSIGRGWALLRENPSLARSLGYDVAAARRRAFFAGSALAGLAGSLSAQAIGIVDPGSYSPLVSLQMFAAVLVGIPAGFMSPIVGLAVTGGIPAALAPAVGGTSDGRIQGVLVALVTFAALIITVRWRGGARMAAPPAPSQGAGEGGVLEGTGQGLIPSGKAALEVRRLNRAFGGVQALCDTSFIVAHGEIRGLIGPNGSGKSTFLRCISGALAADSGEVLLDSADIGNLGEAARVRAGVVRVFQRNAVLTGLAPIDQVALGLRRRTGNTNWIRAALKTPAYRADERKRRGGGHHRRRLHRQRHLSDCSRGWYSNHDRLRHQRRADRHQPAAKCVPHRSAGRAMAQHLATYLAPRGLKLALVHDDTDYGKDGAKQLTSAFGKASIQLAPNIELPSSGIGFSAEALEVKQSGATGVLVWGRAPTIAQFIKDFRQGGGTAALFSGPNAEDPVVRTQNADHPEYVEGLTYASFRITTEGGPTAWGAFRKKYEDHNFNNGGPDLKVGVKAKDKKDVVQPPDWQVFPYDMVYLVKAALEKSGTVDTSGDKLINALNGVQIKSGNGDNRGWTKDNHEGVVDDDIYFAVFSDMKFKPVQDDPLSKSLPPIDQE
ncbi:MAG TPA: ABC transporter substrate-binding protein [Candidatus Dormibacteraeota bacterium]|nr:ABC transporter substrate-binding protein [Candidatus Dormibacteraeota bacterium]